MTSNPTFPNFPKNIPTIDLKSQSAEPTIDIPAIDRIQVLSPDEILEVPSSTEIPAISLGGKISKVLFISDQSHKKSCLDISHSRPEQ